MPRIEENEEEECTSVGREVRATPVQDMTLPNIGTWVCCGGFRSRLEFCSSLIFKISEWESNGPVGIRGSKLVPIRMVELSRGRRFDYAHGGMAQVGLNLGQSCSENNLLASLFC